MDQWVGGMERRAFFLMVLTLVATRKLRFVKRRPFGPLFGYKSPLMGSRLHMLFLLAALIVSMQLNMARRAQDHPGSEADVSRFGRFGRLGAPCEGRFSGPNDPVEA